MVKKGDYTISDIYQGGYSSLKPNYGDVFTGYRTSAGSLGLTTDLRTANMLQEASSKLSTGIKQIELSGVSPEIFESIPKQHLKEINRLSKLTGTEITLHGPVVEASGITQQGFSENNREATERQMTQAIERGHELNPKGNIPVTFHSSAIIPQEITTPGKKPQEVLIINTESGSINKIPIKEKKYPGEETEVTIQGEIKKQNEHSWNENLRQVAYYSDIGGDAVDKTKILKKLAESEKRAGKELTTEEKNAISSYNRGSTFLDSSYGSLKDMFSLAYDNVPKVEKHKIENFYKKIQSKAEQINKNKKSYENAEIKKEIIDEGIELLHSLSTPEIIKPLDDFAKEKTVRTFGNVAWNSYKKFKDKSPIISVENPPAGGAFSTGKELKDVVEKARKQFIEKAVKEGMDKEKARKAAERVIGVTWDVGHINMMRKYGYKTEDIIKETEAVKPLVKHVHLSDNFGGEHTELPMGMGNVPLKEMLKKLGKEGEQAKKIIEAGNWFQHFKTSPVKETFEALGSPIYSMEMAPYWNQSLGYQQGYFGGYGQMLPQGHFETYGIPGFSQLPTELGGQRQVAQGSRMSGKPME